MALRALFVLALWSLLPVGIAAQDVSARAYLTPANGVQVGRAFILNLELNGVQRFDEQPTVPDLEPFAQYLGAGSSTNMQMVGGQTTVSLVVQIRYQAVQEGTHQIPRMSIRAGGQTLTTEPLQVTVTAGPPSPATPGGAAAETDGVPPTELFLTATPSKTSVLEGEPLIMEYRIWTRVDVNGYSITGLPETEGFWVEELNQGEAQTEQRERNGLQYVTAPVRRVALVPSGSGERTVDPLELEAQVRTRTGSRDPFDRLFRGRGTVEPLLIRSNPVTITVRPLPPGRPQPFSGVVGSLSMDASLDRDSVDANDAVTLTLRIAGSGNLRSIPEPALDLADDFEVFPPEVSTSTRRTGSGLSGTRTYEYVLVPRAPGNRVIPALTLGYYDADANQYRTASTGDIPLFVTGTVTDGVGSIGARSGINELRRDIRFIRLGDGDLRPIQGDLFESGAFWLLLLTPMTLVAGALGLRRHQDRLEGDVAYARGRRAGRVAKKRLGTASGLANGSDTRAFYAEVARALRGLVADRLNVAEAGLQTSELRSVLTGHGVQDATVHELIDCLEHCDRQRFAPPTADTSEQTRLLERASALMMALDKELKR